MLTAIGKLALVGFGATAILAGACGRDERNPPSAPLTAGSVGPGGQSSGATTSTGAGGAGGQGGGGPAPEPSVLPKAEGTCPVLDSGIAVVALAGMEPRDVEVRVSSDAQTLDGPFVAVFRAEDQSPSDAITAVLGAEGLDEILDRGGVVVAPDGDPAAGNGVFPWFTYLGGGFDAKGQPDPPDDFRVFDELLACAIEQHGIDTRRIHTMGFHEGSVMAIHTAILRSGFVASTVAHSTAVTGAPAEQDGTNPFAAMLLFGGSTDTDSIIAYSNETPEAATALITPEAPFTTPHFTILCDHGAGTELAKDSVPSTIEFLLDHPYRVVEEPYADGLPKSFPSYCVIHE